MFSWNTCLASMWNHESGTDLLVFIIAMHIGEGGKMHQRPHMIPQSLWGLMACGLIDGMFSLCNCHWGSLGHRQL